MNDTTSASNADPAATAVQPEAGSSPAAPEATGAATVEQPSEQETAAETVSATDGQFMRRAVALRDGRRGALASVRRDVNGAVEAVRLQIGHHLTDWLTVDQLVAGSE